MGVVLEILIWGVLIAVGLLLLALAVFVAFFCLAAALGLVFGAANSTSFVSRAICEYGFWGGLRHSLRRFLSLALDFLASPAFAPASKGKGRDR